MKKEERERGERKENWSAYLDWRNLKNHTPQCMQISFIGDRKQIWQNVNNESWWRVIEILLFLYVWYFSKIKIWENQKWKRQSSLLSDIFWSEDCTVINSLHISSNIKFKNRLHNLRSENTSDNKWKRELKNWSKNQRDLTEKMNGRMPDVYGEFIASFCFQSVNIKELCKKSVNPLVIQSTLF